MVTLVTPTLTVVKKSANALIKRLRAKGIENQGFSILRGNGETVATVSPLDHSRYTVIIDGLIAREILRDEVVQTARLYVDAQRLRKTLDVAP